MWTWLASFLGGPVITGLINAYKAKLDSDNTEGAQAADVTKAALLAEIDARKSANTIIIAEQGRWWTAMPRSVVQWSFAIFVFKCVVWDNVLALGTTDPLGGDIQVWAGWVMALWFGGRTIEKVATTIWGARR
jgi:hypothetical protein